MGYHTVIGSLLCRQALKIRERTKGAYQRSVPKERTKGAYLLERSPKKDNPNLLERSPKKDNPNPLERSPKER